MILPDTEILKWIEAGGMNKYNPDHINPASIDLTMGDTVIDLWTGTKKRVSEITLYPGMAILAATDEYIRLPSDIAGAVYLKSSLARKGLDHALAGWVDPGFHGELTLELHSHRPITICAHQRIVQLVLMRMEAPPRYDYSYTGRYNGQTGPTEAR